MKNIKNILAFILLTSSIVSFAQDNLTGIIIENTQGKESPLPMAGIKWQRTKLSTTSDENGSFKIAYPDSIPALLIASMIGYKNDTILVSDRSKRNIKISLRSSATTLNEVSIAGKLQSSSNMMTTPINVEKITQEELTLAACCNISESFERNASVDVNFTDAVSGAKQIQMLGLDGIYTQILYENLPFVRGLSSSYGLTYIPGPWVENILVTKGTGSVVNGYESITGQIQIELLEPNKADRVFINGYGNNNQRFELNAHVAKKINPHLSTLAFAHANRNDLNKAGNMDQNKDGFMDMPFETQYNFLNRWHYEIKHKAEGQFGIRALIEDRTGGQNHNLMNDSTGMARYGIGINTKQFETFTKNGFMFPETPWKSIAIMTTERYHTQNAYFGKKRYEGEQKSLYVNTIYQTIINNTFHKIKFGGSFIMDNYNESFTEGILPNNDSVFSKQEIIPGGYTEYTFNNDTNLSVVAGIRGDYFDANGLKINPRLHLKYNPSKEIAIRLSGGRGMRTAHIFAENSQVFASSRQIAINETLEPEVAWNYGMTFTYKFKPFGREASLNLDAYRTEFEDQVVVDLEDVDKVQFYNLRGLSYSNSIQTDLSFSPSKSLDVKFAYKYYDVKTTYQPPGQVRQLLGKPLVPKDRALMNIDYATHAEKWKFSFTAKWFGKSRLPNTLANEPQFQLKKYSDTYYTFMTQITKKFKWIEVYLGAENLLDYRIPNPIIDPANPYGTNFDATMIWGPINGRVIYGGFRYKII
jgi:outer membrane receptor for ferrienterochelin and colicins